MCMVFVFSKGVPTYGLARVYRARVSLSLYFRDKSLRAKIKILNFFILSRRFSCRKCDSFAHAIRESQTDNWWVWHAFRIRCPRSSPDPSLLVDLGTLE